MRELLVESYATSHKPRNWRLALLENWYYASRYIWTLSICWTREMWQGKLDLSKQGEIKCRPCHQRL
jgi:hypothetical protein